MSLLMEGGWRAAEVPGVCPPKLQCGSFRHGREIASSSAGNQHRAHQARVSQEAHLGLVRFSEVDSQSRCQNVTLQRWPVTPGVLEKPGGIKPRLLACAPRVDRVTG